MIQLTDTIDNRILPDEFINEYSISNIIDIVLIKLFDNLKFLNTTFIHTQSCNFKHQPNRKKTYPKISNIENIFNLKLIFGKTRNLVRHDNMPLFQ